MSRTDDGPEIIDMMGGQFEISARYDTRGDEAVIMRTRMPPGRVVPLHRHDDPECLYVLTGTLQVWLADPEPGWRPVEEGRSVLIPNDADHALRNAGDVPVDLIIGMNGRLAQFFREAGRPGVRGDPRPATPEAVERAVRAAERFGYWIASPAEAEAIIGPSARPVRP